MIFLKSGFQMIDIIDIIKQSITELDDGKILTGNPIKFDGKTHGFL